MEESPARLGGECKGGYEVAGGVSGICARRRKQVLRDMQAKEKKAEKVKHSMKILHTSSFNSREELKATHGAS